VTTLTEPAPRLTRAQVACRVAQELPDGGIVNLGIGIPAMCADYIPAGVQIRYHAENGMLGFGALAPDSEGDPNVMDAAGKFPYVVPGMAFFDSAESFALIRGGHIDVTVLGALQVSRTGDLANWKIPARGIGSIGGGMDLAANAKRVIVAMEHTDRKGNPKIVDHCTFPLTAPTCVDQIVTDIAVIDVLPDGWGMVLREVAPGWNAESVQALTEPKLTIAANLRQIKVA
jgi:3-oxoacid CoA-transferase subunit B